MRDMDRKYEKFILKLNYYKAYVIALKKLRDRDLFGYDEFGYLKPEYELAKEENEAVISYLNGSDKQVSKIKNR